MARSIITQSQVRERTSRQPSRSSTRKDAGALVRSSVGTRRVSRKPALTRKVRASRARVPPAPMRATRMPEIEGPTNQPKPSAMPRRALASCSRSAGTICWMSAPKAGKKNASPQP